LQRAAFSLTLSDMEVQFTPEQEAQLAQIATNAGTDAQALVKEAALRLLQSNGGFRVALPGSVVAAMRAFALASNPIPKDGLLAIRSITDAARWPWSSMRPLPLPGLCPMKAAATPTLF